MFSWSHNSRKYLLSTIWLQDCKQGNILGKYGRMHLPKKDQQTQILYECVTSLAKNLHILLVIPFIYISHTNRSETSPSGNLASYHDNCHHLGLTKFCNESQGVVDKETRKHLSIELAWFFVWKTWRRKWNERIKTRDSHTLIDRFQYRTFIKDQNQWIYGFDFCWLEESDQCFLCLHFGKNTHWMFVFSLPFSDSLSCSRNS